MVYKDKIIRAEVTVRTLHDLNEEGIRVAEREETDRYVVYEVWSGNYYVAGGFDTISEATTYVDGLVEAEVRS